MGSIVFLLIDFRLGTSRARHGNKQKAGCRVVSSRVQYRIGLRTLLVVNRVRLPSNMVLSGLKRSHRKGNVRACAINHEEALTCRVDLGM